MVHICIVYVYVVVVFFSSVEQPDSCHGVVSCSVFTKSNNPQSTSIILSLNEPSPIRCATAFEFMLGDEVIETNATSATFQSYSFGVTYANQTVYPLDAEGRRGAVPCYYSISG